MPATVPSGSYVHATYMQRRAIWSAHRDYVEGLLYTLAHDPDLPHRLDTAWGLCADEFDTPFLRTRRHASPSSSLSCPPPLCNCYALCNCRPCVTATPV